MQNRILLVITIVLSLILVFISSSTHTTFFNTKASKKISVLDAKTNNISKLELEDYIVGVVAAEMPASFNDEALKAQAVAARTYAVYKIANSNKIYDVVTDVSNQSYITVDEMKNKWLDDFDKYYTKVKNAVNATNGEIMYYNDEIVEAYYFAMSNGFTEDVSLVFSEDRDYLQSVPSTYDNNNLKNFTYTEEFTKNEICEKLQISCDNLTFTDIKRSNTNRVNTLVVSGKEFKGTNFRSLLGLRSTDFDIDVNGDKIIITTRGYGHGVGMSQYGANGMANAGYTYDKILKYYYKNVEIAPI